MRSSRFLLHFLLYWPILALTACMQDGRLEITLDLEQQEATLNPLRHPSLSSFTLAVATGTYADKATEFYYSGRHRLDFGKVAVGKYSRIALTATSFFGATLAYGEVRGDFHVGAEEPLRVEIPLRYPFVYATGGYGLPPLHPELDSSMASFMNIPVGTSPETTSAAAVSPDGTLLVAASGNPNGDSIKLWVLLTRNHKKLLDTTLPRTTAINRMAFSPDGKILSLLSTSGGWVGFVDVDALLAGRNVMTFEEIERPIDGVFVNDQTWVALQSTPYRFSLCETSPLPASSLTWFSVARRNDALDSERLPTMALDKYASSLAVDTAVRRVYVSHACDSEIAVMEMGAVQTSTVLSPLNLSPCLRPVQMAVGQSELLVACSTAVDTSNPQWTSAKLLVQRYSLRPQLNPNGRPIVMDYPWEPFILNKDDDPLHHEALVVLQMAPVRLLPRAVGLTAAGSRVVMAVEAYHHTDSFSSADVSVQETSVKSHSVVFVDPRVAQLGRRVRTACFQASSPDDNAMPAGLAPDDACSLGFGTFDVTPVSFIPSQIAITFAAP